MYTACCCQAKFKAREKELAAAQEDFKSQQKSLTEKVDSLQAVRALNRTISNITVSFSVLTVLQFVNSHFDLIARRHVRPAIDMSASDTEFMVVAVHAVCRPLHSWISRSTISNQRTARTRRSSSRKLRTGSLKKVIRYQPSQKSRGLY